MNSGKPFRTQRDKVVELPAIEEELDLTQEFNLDSLALDPLPQRSHQPHLALIP